MFESAIRLVLKHEGGYTNNPNDAGKATNYGVSLRFLANHPEDGDFDNDGDVDENDIAMMTLDDAKAIYRKHWWDKYRYSQIADPTIATKVFDLSVNMGAKRAHILLQQAMNKAFGLKLKCDGIIGPNTLRTLNAIADGDEEQELLTAYCDEAWAFYLRLIAANPKYKVFAKGWKNRAYSIGIANSVVEPMKAN